MGAKEPMPWPVADDRAVRAGALAVELEPSATGNRKRLSACPCRPGSHPNPVPGAVADADAAAGWQWYPTAAGLITKCRAYEDGHDRELPRKTWPPALRHEQPSLPPPGKIMILPLGHGCVGASVAPHIAKPTASGGRY
jgi:hypothetical protein